MKYIAEMRVDLDALSFNLQQIRQMAGSERAIMAMVKGDAYGHGIVEVARHLAELGVRDFGVAHVSEARLIRQDGFAGRIIVFQPDFWSDLNSYQELDLECVINAPDELVLLEGGFDKVCHVMVDTGMGREGMLPDDVVPVLERVACIPSIELRGLCTHFACADQEDPSDTRRQLNLFNDVIESLPSTVRSELTLHAANSGGIINIPDSHFDLVRPGIFLYGLYQGAGTFTQRPAMSIWAKLVLKKAVPKGWRVGYGGTYVVPEDTHLGILGLGYADGFLRANSNLGHVWFEGHRFPVRGRVSMDQIIIDLGCHGHIPVGSEFLVFGGDADDAASLFADATRHGTITYERATQLGMRLPKVYASSGEVARHSCVPEALEKNDEEEAARVDLKRVNCTQSKKEENSARRAKSLQ